MQVRAGREESPIIGGLVHQNKPDANQFAPTVLEFKKSSQPEQKSAAGNPRPIINKPVVEGIASKKRPGGFGGFKAPPATDLID